MDYSVFDSLLDSVFVVDNDRKITYCNSAAAAFCESSVRRLTKGISLYQIISFSDESLFVMPHGTWGRDSATPSTEVEFVNLQTNKKGRVQLSIQPFFENPDRPRWVLLIRDV